MSRRIVVEALVVVIGLRWDELRGRGPVPGPVTVDGRPAGGRRGATASPQPARARRPSPTPASASSSTLRPLQDPERAPLTAIYLEQLLAALDADPLDGESFSFLLAADHRRPDRRAPRTSRSSAAALLPPTRLLRSGALTVDPFLLRGASLGRRLARRARRRSRRPSTTRPAARSRSRPASRSSPRCSTSPRGRCPRRTSAGTAARFGQRLRARLLRDAAAVLVPGAPTATEARRLLHVPSARRIRVVPARAAPGVPARGARRRAARERDAAGPRERYAVYAGRYDARQDLPTLLEALARLATCRPTRPDGRARRRRGRRASASWARRPMTVPRSRGPRPARGVADALAYAPALPPERLAALVAGARFLRPAGPARRPPASSALEAIAAGVPVVASAVGRAARGRRPRPASSWSQATRPGLRPRSRAAWSDDDLHAQLVEAALERRATMRTWSDVAWDTRTAWADVARPAPFL